MNGVSEFIVVLWVFPVILFFVLPLFLLTGKTFARFINDMVAIIRSGKRYSSNEETMGVNH